MHRQNITTVTLVGISRRRFVEHWRRRDFFELRRRTVADRVNGI